MTKDELRKHLRERRRAHVAALPDQVRALLFRRAPAPIVDLLREGATVGIYRSSPQEAPTGGYARWLFEEGFRIALPRFAERAASMEFAPHTDPHDESDLVEGPFGPQPRSDALSVVPEALFVPLLGFTPEGHRLGQGGGHYDRWLADHPGTLAIGLAWDAQCLDEIPVEPHDVTLEAVVTSTRIYRNGR